MPTVTQRHTSHEVFACRQALAFLGLGKTKEKKKTTTCENVKPHKCFGCPFRRREWVSEKRLGPCPTWIAAVFRDETVEGR